MSAPSRSALVSPQRETWLMYRSMVGIGLVCGILLVAVYLWSKPIIERNREEALQRAIFQVLTEAKTSVTFVLGEDGSFSPLVGKAGSSRVVHAGYAADGSLAGLAIEASGTGYQDVIKVIYGYSPERQTIVGFRVLESRETPGLGDRIDFDPQFLANFESLDVALTADGAAIAHPIVSVKRGEKTEPWQIDAITGATVSSVAVTKMLRESTAFWMPKLTPRLDDFRTKR